MSDGRHASKTSRIKPAYLIGGGVIVVAAVVLGFVLLGGTDNLPVLGPNRPPTPDFAFKMTKVVPVATRADVTHADLEAAAEPVAQDVADEMETLYVGAFLDPANWQEGSYDDVWDRFDEGASTEAQQQVDTLTAGIGAGDAFDRILPSTGVLTTKVLFDQDDQPFSVVAIVEFEAVGRGKDGQDLSITSHGQFVFQEVDGSWKVVSFRVLRNDELQEPSPSATPSASGTSS